MDNKRDLKNNLNKNLKISLKGSPNSKLLKEYKKTLSNLSNLQWEISIGLMLGDVSLQIQNKGRTYRMKFEWGDKNKIYADYVHSVFNEWILSPPHKKIRVNVNGNIVYT